MKSQPMPDLSDGPIGCNWVTATGRSTLACYSGRAGTLFSGHLNPQSV